MTVSAPKSALFEPLPSAYRRVPFLVAALFALLIGAWAGLLRIGWHLPELRPDLTAAHGPLMVSGFLGTLISLERAIAVVHVIQNARLKPLPYAIPALTFIGTIAVLAHMEKAALFMVAGSIGYIVLCGYMFYRRRTFDVLLMGAGALNWFSGNAAWLSGDPLYQVAPLWMTFLILTIAAERLELAVLRRISRNPFLLFLGAISAIGYGTWWSDANYENGMRLFSAGALALALWLLNFDIARRTIYKTGITRFIAACLLSGYLWLGVGGVLGILYGGVMAGPRYDAILHSIFLGFVMAMIFGHAPIIFPAILNTPLQYHRGLYAHLILLHGSLVVRIGGDLLPDVTLRRWGGMLNALVLVVFLMNTAYSLRTAMLPRRLSMPERLTYLVAVPAVIIGMALVAYGFLGNSPAAPAIISNEPSATLALDENSIARGETAYRTFCAACHGLDARGLAGLGKDLIGSDFVRDSSDAALREFIIVGRPAWDSANTTGIEMPARGLPPGATDAEIEAIVAFLRARLPN